MTSTCTTIKPSAPVLDADLRTIRMWDGTELRYRAWNAEERRDRAVLVFHRGHEHSGRLDDVVRRLGLDDSAVFAWDARGHGRSPGPRGHAESFATYVRDADCFAAGIADRYGIPVRNMTVLAHSVGAVIAATWVHDYAPPIKAMVLVAPAFRVKLYVPLAIPMCRLLLGIRGPGRAFLKSYVAPSMLTHDPDEARRYAADPLITRNIAVKVLLDLHDTSTRLLDDAAAIRTPTMIVAAGSDRVVRLEPQRRFFEALSSPHKQLLVVPGFYHDVLHERGAAGVLQRMRAFLVEAHDNATGEASGAIEESGRSTYRQLRRPLPALSPRRLGFAGQRLALRTAGRVSSGIRLGWATGFDSGSSLDYVYENHPRGLTPVGRLIDRAYLNSPGWTGVRVRKRNLEHLLRSCITDLHAADQPVRLIDIAAGPGRYVLETLASTRPPDTTALLRDRDPANLVRGESLARELGVTGVTFESADAFDTESLASVLPRNLAIASGVYELFADNRMVLRSLRGLARAVVPGGFLIYTNQPWHPQLEMIARVLVNRDGAPWIMRCRSQVEMDDLIRAAGFEKLTTMTDEHGIFTVSLARRSTTR